MGWGNFQDLAALQDWGFIQTPNLSGPTHSHRMAREALQSFGAEVEEQLLGW